MKIEAVEHLTYPAELVFETVRDKTPELASIMPNIEGVEVLSREEKPPVVHVYARWQGSSGDVPRVIRPFVKKELLAWMDRAAWDAEQRTCEWAIEAAVGQVFSCEGHTTIADAEGGAVFTIKGELRVDPNKVPGVPRFLARKLKDPLERFIANAIRPNLTSIAKAVQEYLDQRP